MYLVSAYFDDKTSNRIQKYINQIAEKTGNDFMTQNQVPPHMTISSIEARNVELLVPHVAKLEESLRQGTISFVSVGMLFPYVIYMTPVLNEYLQWVSQQIYDIIPKDDEIIISKYYKPMQWLPHVTLGKKLSKEQMQTAFNVMQEGFVPFEGRITSIGLAKTNPHIDVMKYQLMNEIGETKDERVNMVEEVRRGSIR